MLHKPIPKRSGLVMNKVAILHHDLEWTEKCLAEEFVAKRIDHSCHDIRTVSFGELAEMDLIINRVYASVANRDYPSITKALSLINRLHDTGVRCLNGPKGTQADYEKTFAYQRQSEAGVAVPGCSLLKTDTPDSMLAEIDHFASHYSYPVILKPNTGGRGKDVYKIDRAENIPGTLNIALAGREATEYVGGWIVQEFVPSVFPYDVRVVVSDGKVAHAHRRSLIAVDAGPPWMGSRCLGSKCEAYSLSNEEINLALNATKAIEADFNVLDVVIGKNGPVIIENNTTPNFDEAGAADGADVFIDTMIHATRIMKK